MDWHLLTQGFPVLYECFGCGKLFSKNHNCEAINETCTDCHRLGHYSGFCKQRKLPKLRRPRIDILQEILNDSPEFVEKSDPVIVAVTINNQQETTHAASTSYQEENIAQIQDENTLKIELDNSNERVENRKIRLVKSREQINGNNDTSENSKESVKDLRLKLQVSRKRGRCFETDKIEENVPTNQSYTDEINSYKSLSASLKEQNSVLLQEHDTLKTEIIQLKETLNSEQKQAEKYQAKLKMYRNASLGKTLDRLKEQTERSNRRAKELEEQRKRLYLYVKKVEAQAEKANARVNGLIQEYETVSSRLYPHYPKEQIPKWPRLCINCCSPQFHHPYHCVARGVTCQNCLKKNHLTAVCHADSDQTCKPTLEEIELMRNVAKDIYQ